MGDHQDVRTVLCGELQKRGQRGINWKNRFFKLTPKELLYYERDSLKGTFSTDGAILKADERSLEFSLITAAGVSVVMRADSAQNKTSWVQAIEAILKVQEPKEVKPEDTFIDSSAPASASGALAQDSPARLEMELWWDVAVTVPAAAARGSPKSGKNNSTSSRAVKLEVEAAADSSVFSASGSLPAERDNGVAVAAVVAAAAADELDVEVEYQEGVGQNQEHHDVVGRDDDYINEEDDEYGEEVLVEEDVEGGDDEQGEQHDLNPNEAHDEGQLERFGSDFSMNASSSDSLNASAISLPVDGNGNDDAEHTDTHTSVSQEAEVAAAIESMSAALSSSTVENAEEASAADKYAEGSQEGSQGSAATVNADAETGAPMVPRTPDKVLNWVEHCRLHNHNNHVITHEVL
jgi:hypothetical protein